MIFRNLFRRRTRTLLTILGIAIGIACIVTLVALSRGVASNYLEATNRSEAHITVQAVQAEGQALTLGTGFDESVVDTLRALPEVKTAAGMLYTMVRVPGAPMFIVFGYEPDQPGVDHFKVTEGVTLAETRSRRGGRPMLLGRTAADKLHRSVGDTLRVEDTTFRIVGIYETGVAFEDAGSVISLQDAQMLADMPHQVIYAGVRLYDPTKIEQVKVKIARLLPRDVEVAGTQIGSMLLDMLGMMDVFAWAVSLIAAAVGGVGMMNTMLMSVFERTREIGVLRSVGWRPWRIIRMILGEALVLSLMGGLLGLGIGMGLTWLSAHSAAMGGLTKDSVPLAVVVQSLAAAIVLGLIGGLYPAWRASRLPPVVALAYDGSDMSKQRKVLPFGGMPVKNLTRQRTRTALTLLGVGIAVVAMVLIGSSAEGMMVGFNGALAGAEISVAERDQPDTTLSSIDERVLHRIAAMPEVEYVSGLIFTVVSTADAPFFMIMARSRNDPELKPDILREGRLLQSRRECLLGWKSAQEQNRQLGDKLHLLGTTFIIVGIVETGNTFEDGGAIIELSEAQTLLKKPHQVMSAEIALVDTGQTDTVLAELGAAYPELIFTRSAELAENLPDMQMTNQSINAVYLMTVIVGSIALMNTMIMSIFERTREIGVLRAVGWRKRHVLWEIMLEALLVTLLAGLLGLLASIAIIQIMAHSGALGVYSDLFLITPKLIAQALGFSIVLGIIGGLYPAWRATKFRPVEALRYE
jgi:ABC-type antimicrobial peptide transport system permease subunit